MSEKQPATLMSVSATLKDFYPLPGTRIKQYVVDTQREREWQEKTCPRVTVPDHQHWRDDDPPIVECGGEFNWLWLSYQSCDFCENLYYELRDTPAVQAWFVEKAKRPPIESDRTKLSDEIAPDLAMREQPWHAMLPRKK